MPSLNLFKAQQARPTSEMEEALSEMLKRGELPTFILGASGQAVGDGNLPITLTKSNGSIAAPLATLTGIVNADFALPGGDLVIPAGLLIPGVSKLRIEAHIRRTTATATASLIVRLGKLANSVVAFSATYAATANLDYRLLIDVLPFANDGFMRSNWSPVNSPSASSYGDCQNADVSFSENQVIKFRIEAANAADNFILTSYHITAFR